MERLNELQVFRADGDRARGCETVLVARRRTIPFWKDWWPPGHIIGWGDTFVRGLPPLPPRDRRRRGGRALRRRLRGRLSRVGGVRRDRPLRRDRCARDDRVPQLDRERPAVDCAMGTEGRPRFTTSSHWGDADRLPGADHRRRTRVRQCRGTRVRLRLGERPTVAGGPARRGRSPAAGTAEYARQPG